MSRFSGKADVYDWFFLGRDCDLDYIKRSKIYIKYPSDIKLKIPPQRIHIKTLQDLVPYYPHLVYGGLRKEEYCTIFISEEPYPDMLWRKMGKKPLTYDDYKLELQKELERVKAMGEDSLFSKDYFINYDHIQSFFEWWQRNRERKFKYWIYKRAGTPHEKAEQFTDEIIFEDLYANLGYIKEAVVLPDNDLLLGFLKDDEKEIEYVKFSEIRMVYDKIDQGDY